MLFAKLFDFSGEMRFVGICILIIVIVGLCKSVYSHYVLMNNPEAWKAMQAAEEDKAARKREAVGRASFGLFKIFQLWRK
jgi:hypothetical protein